MATITIQQTATPSRSKQAGPCWIALGDNPDNYLFAATTPRTQDAEIGQTLTITGAVALRRASRTDKQRQTWTVEVTGDPQDQVEVSLGSPQSVDAIITGVREA